MTVNIVGQASPNTFAFETSALIKPQAFENMTRAGGSGSQTRRKNQNFNLMGVQAIGMGLGTLIRRMGVSPDIVTGHDFRREELDHV